MTDQQILSALKQVFDTCTANGMCKSLQQAVDLANLYNQVETRLKAAEQP